MAFPHPPEVDREDAPHRVEKRPAREMRASQSSTLMADVHIVIHRCRRTFRGAVRRSRPCRRRRAICPLSHRKRWKPIWRWVPRCLSVLLEEVRGSRLQRSGGSRALPECIHPRPLYRDSSTDVTVDRSCSCCHLLDHAPGGPVEPNSTRAAIRTGYERWLLVWRKCARRPHTLLHTSPPFGGLGLVHPFRDNLCSTALQLQAVQPTAERGFTSRRIRIRSEAT